MATRRPTDVVLRRPFRRPAGRALPGGRDRRPAATGSSSIRSPSSTASSSRPAWLRQTPATPCRPTHDIEAIVANEAPDSPILSMTVVDGPTGLAAVEPSLGTGQQGLIDQPVLWIVRVLESERVSTYVVIDGSDAIYEMNPEGEAILVGGTPPTPGASPSAGPWPPADALVLELPGVDIGKPPVRVAIVDESGRFVSAMEQDPATITLDGRFGAYRGTGQTGTRQPDLGRRDLRQPDHDHGRGGPSVDHLRHGSATGLRFDRRRAPADPRTSPAPWTCRRSRSVEAAAVPSPPAGVPPGYALDCGPLAPDACESRAAEIVAADAGRNGSSRSPSPTNAGRMRSPSTTGPAITAMRRLHPRAPGPS